MLRRPFTRIEHVADDGARRGNDMADRETHSFRLGHEPTPPRLYFKPAPPLRHPRHNDLLGLHRLIAGMEMYYASPAGSRLPVAPPGVSFLLQFILSIWR